MLKNLIRQKAIEIDEKRDRLKSAYSEKVLKPVLN